MPGCCIVSNHLGLKDVDESKSIGLLPFADLLVTFGA